MEEGYRLAASLTVEEELCRANLDYLPIRGLTPIKIPRSSVARTTFRPDTSLRGTDVELIRRSLPARIRMMA
jgi:hypothetical protein